MLILKLHFDNYLFLDGKFEVFFIILKQYFLQNGSDYWHSRGAQSREK